MAKTPCFDSPPSMHTKRRVMCSNLSVMARLCLIQPKDKSRQKGSGLLANIFGTSEGSDWHGLDCSNRLEVLFRQTCSRLLQNHFLAFLSSLQPKNVVCRNWSSAVNSAYSTSQTSLGRTHWIFSLMLGGLTNGHLLMKSVFIRSTASFSPFSIKPLPAYP